MIKPSEPVIFAAFANSVTKSYVPAACEGSTIIGKFESFLIMGTDDRSNVNLVSVTKVVMPLSHKITSMLPSFITYSAALNHFSIVALIFY